MKNLNVFFWKYESEQFWNVSPFFLHWNILPNLKLISQIYFIPSYVSQTLNFSRFIAHQKCHSAPIQNILLQCQKESWKLNNSSKLIRYICNMMWQQRSHEFWKSNHSLYSEIMQGETQHIVAPTHITTCSPAEDLFQMVQVTSFTPLCNSKFCSPRKPLVVLTTSIRPEDWDSVHALSSGSIHPGSKCHHWYQLPLLQAAITFRPAS